MANIPDYNLYGKRIELSPLNHLETTLLISLSFHRGLRDPATQLNHAASMYLRSGRDRILGEAQYYADLLGLDLKAYLQRMAADPVGLASDLKAIGAESFIEPDWQDSLMDDRRDP